MNSTIRSVLHPGRILLEHHLARRNISVFRLARDIGVSPLRIYEVVQGERSITPMLALRLAHYFGLSRRVWLDLQARYDQQLEPETIAGKVIDIITIRKHRTWTPPARPA
jgi:addiction module HigA family antidote